MVGYTFMGWSTDSSWTNLDPSQVALFNNCKSFASSASNSIVYEEVDAKTAFYDSPKTKKININIVTI